MTTRADLQQLYDECTRSDPGRVYYRDDCVGDLVTALGDFLAGDDPTVEIAYLKATLADVKAEREAAQENARAAWAVHSEHTDRTGVIIAAHVRDAVFATTRAEKAEAAIERLTADLDRCREQCGCAVDRAQQHQARAEAAEQAIQRVRSQCDFWSHGNSWNRAARNAILRALDGGEQHG